MEQLIGRISRYYEYLTLSMSATQDQINASQVSQLVHKIHSVILQSLVKLIYEGVGASMVGEFFFQLFAINSKILACVLRELHHLLERKSLIVLQ